MRICRRQAVARVSHDPCQDSTGLEGFCSLGADRHTQSTAVRFVHQPLSFRTSISPWQAVIDETVTSLHVLLVYTFISMLNISQMNLFTLIIQLIKYKVQAFEQLSHSYREGL